MATTPALAFAVAAGVTGLRRPEVDPLARGVIARTIEKLWDTTDRIDILYICSNQAIAAQNINRLNVLNRRELALPTRMTLIPLQVRGDQGLDANKVNFISLTPGTTFDLRSTTGVTRERALLLRMLEGRVSRSRGLHNLLQATAGFDGWNGAVRDLTLDGIDEKIITRFRRDVEARGERGIVAPPVDERLLSALRAGLPDCAGVALGIDRLLMAMRGSDRIADVLAFPFGHA